MSECQIQNSIVVWYNNTYCLIGDANRCLIFSIPNDSKNRIDIYKKKATGLLAGVSDLIIIHKKSPDYLPIVLFVEVKTDVGRLSQHQVAFGQRVADLGLIYSVVRSLDEFKLLISTL